MISLLLGRDDSGETTYTLSPPQSTADAASITLLAGVAQSVTVPSTESFYEVFFSIEPGVRVWVASGTTASVPVGNTFAGTRSVMNPTGWDVAGGTVLSCITADTTADVGIVFCAKGIR